MFEKLALQNFAPHLLSTFFQDFLCMPCMKMCFSTSNLFLIEIVEGKGEKCGLSPSLWLTPPVSANRSCVWRSPGMGGITQIPENSRDYSQIQGRGVRPLTTQRKSLQLIERLRM